MSQFFGQVGYFQLLNLVKNKVPFLLAGFSKIEATKHPELNKILEKIETFSVDGAADKIIAAHPDKNSPIVLLCGNGANSEQIAKELSAKGYLNIFVVKNGFEGLLIEVTEGL